MERQLTNFLHARGATLLFLLASCAVACVAWSRALVLPVVPDLGLGIPAPGEWLGHSFLSLLLCMAVNVAVGMLVICINRAFNTLRSLTALGATLFYVLQCAMPPLLAQFYGGMLLVLIAMLCVALLFSVYGRGSLSESRQKVYLIFFLLTVGGFTQISFLLFVPVFLFGCIQMRVLNLRTALAALLGIVTPPWILFGFGIVEPWQLHWPRLVVAWNLFDTEEMVKALVDTGFTLVAGMAFMMLNLLKILSYNSRTRAFNGFINVLWIATALFTVLNFNDFAFYIPLLNALAGYQAAHFFTYRRQRRSYLPVVLLIAVYAFFCVWSFI